MAHLQTPSRKANSAVGVGALEPPHSPFWTNPPPPPFLLDEGYLRGITLIKWEAFQM